MDEKIQKINILYLLGYIFIPIIICAIGYSLCYLFFEDGGTGAVLTTLVPSVIAMVWWIFGGSIIFKRKTKELEQQFQNEGYRANQTFYGKGKTVVLDIEKGMLGIVSFWNPFKNYIIPASRIGRAWTDDGRSGVGILEGSSQVKFVFTVDDIKINIPTFTSNQRFRMDDKHILTGISKADLMVESIEKAKKNSENGPKTSKNIADKSSDSTSKSDSKSGKSTASEKSK